MAKQYWGDAEVISKTEHETKTPLGMPIYRVELSDGRTLNLTKKLFDAGVSDTLGDLNTLYDTYAPKIVRDMEIFLDEWGVSDDDYSRLMAWIGRVLDVKRDAAFSKAIGVKDVSEWSLVNYHLINGTESDNATE